MPRSKRYFYDWTNHAGVRYRLTITPSGNQIDYWLAVGTKPAFGAGSSGTYLRIPDGAILREGMELPECGFEGDIPVGLVEPPTFVVRIDCSVLEGEADFEDLIGYLTTPSTVTIDELVYGADDILLSGTHGMLVGMQLTTTAVYRYITPTNVIRLDTDDGTSSLTASQFRCVFEGGQRPLFGEDAKQMQWECSETAGTAILEIEATDILQMIAEQIIPADVAQHVLYEYGGELSVPLYTMLDLAWTNAAETIGYLRTLGDSHNADDRRGAKLLPLKRLWHGIETLLTRAYRLFTRDDDEDTNVQFLEHILPGSSTALQVGPFSVQELRQQAYTYEGAASSTTLDDSTAERTRRFPAVVVYESDTSTAIAGYLVDDGENETSIFAFKNLYEYLVESIAGAGAAGTMPSELQAGRTIQFSGTFSASSHGITTSVIASPRTIEVNAGLLTGADADVPGASGGDESPVEYRTPMMPDDNNWTVPVTFHNMPKVGEDSDRTFFILDASSYPTISSLFEVRSPLEAYNTIWYLDTVGFLDTQYPVRAHHYVGISDGVSIQFEGTDGIALPTPSLPATNAPDYDTTWLTWWRDLRLAMLHMQTQACMPYCVAKRIARQFGTRNQCAYPAGEISAELAPTQHLGRRGDSGWADGSDLTGKSYHAIYPGQPILVRTAINIDTQRATAKLLGVA